MLCKLFVALVIRSAVAAVPKPLSRRRFRSNGPILTISIPSDLSVLSSTFDCSSKVSEINSDSSDGIIYPIKKKRSINKIMKRRIRSLKNLAHGICDTVRPSSVYTLTTTQPPLPYWCPALKACSARIGYTHHTEKDARSNIFASGPLEHSSNLPSDDSMTQKVSHLQSIHQESSSSGFIEGISKFEFNLIDRNDVLQLAIKPCFEWLTLGNPRERESSPNEPQQSTISKSSVLFHARRDASNYAWCRFMSSATTPLNDSASAPVDDSTSRNIDSSDDRNEAKARTNTNGRWFETTIRMSTLFPIPLVSVSSIRITPTLQFMQIPRLRRGRNGTTLKTTQFDASCQLEATSGGPGRTTATLTVSPLDATQFMKLAMEYRFSGFGVGKFFRPRRRNEQESQSQTPPQHWIRQIWEWNRLGIPARTSARTKSYSSFMMERYRSARTTILASQYQWLIVWPSGQSFRTIFDPPPMDSKYSSEKGGVNGGSLSFTWIDPSKQMIRDTTFGGMTGSVGAWITDVRIPFLDATPKGDAPRHGSLLVRNLAAAEIRVRRQFSF